MSKMHDRIMSFKLPNYLREEVSRTATAMEMSDSNLVKIAITSAVHRFATGKPIDAVNR